MSVIDSEIKYYGSAIMPNDDVTNNAGGAIDLLTRIVFTDISADDTVEVLSSAAGDTTQTLTVYGRDAGGTIVSEGLALNGTTVVTSTQSFERILRIEMTATATGTVTLRKQTDDVTIAQLEPGERYIRRPFYDAAADAGGGSARDYYEKIFCKNTNGVTALTSATIAELSDPSGKVTFALEATLDGSDSLGAANNRQTVGDISGYTFNGTTKNVANSQSLTAGAAQGLWLKLSLAAGDAANNTTYQLRLSGQTV